MQADEVIEAINRIRTIPHPGSYMFSGLQIVAAGKYPSDEITKLCADLQDAGIFILSIVPEDDKVVINLYWQG